jgi:hypothetical protein
MISLRVPGILKLAAIVLIVAVGLIHLLFVQRSPTYLGALFAANFLGALIAAAGILLECAMGLGTRRPSRRWSVCWLHSEPHAGSTWFRNGGRDVGLSSGDPLLDSGGALRSSIRWSEGSCPAVKRSRSLGRGAGYLYSLNCRQGGFPETPHRPGPIA